MQNLLRAGVLSLALVPLAGCAEFDKIVNDAVDWIDAPKTQQALSSLRSGATAFTCAVASVSAIAGEIETGVGAGKSLIGTDGKVYVASAAICAALGGAVGPQAMIP